ncbi:penicillin-binding protein 1A [Capnocytophaga haemolytica]|uniref:Penicillin-binding protein n=1 Tax=Capnocytophaga haemolytica TaxID=45243 RepID=A0AAX2H0V6_9FLAO|nr:transglycosylase domain-containing protein [Capnocytophaga haemolytica]AMD85768.1 penicillin-binding protein [Capnocytophaga haemolytica]SFN83084.1 penicillin-binding protein 1A [Capnocytophaga haemolytica]SNV15980.1 Penicillin-binding protein 1A [Capnocytophaga haemolytica]
MKKTTENEETDTSKKRFLKWFWGVFAAGVLLVILLFLSASLGLLGEMPDFKHLENPDTNLATEIVSADGKSLGKFYLDENRTPIKFKDLPKPLVDALIATEDERFYQHSGIDVRGTMRALFFLGTKGGASTISQQLAKQLFHKTKTRGLQRYTQKIKEWVIATRLERQYTKEEILAMYFNIYDFNNNADGIRSAARIYFGKEPKDLKIEEGAMLVGMFKNSALYNPLKNKEGVTNRRNVVLSQMAKNNYITQEEKDSLQALPLKIKYTPESHNDGIATYFREYLRSYMKAWIEANPKPDGSKHNLYLDGLKVYTTIDSKMQAYAEEAVKAHMKQLQKAFDAENNPKKNKTFPFVRVSNDEYKSLMEKAMKNSNRWIHLKYLGYSEDEIRATFDKKVEMRVFSWKGEKDTIMTPRDSILYYKAYLRAGVMSMETNTGHIKAWVGGINYKHFQYDQVIQGARQTGSTFKPFVYATAIDQLHYSPCLELPDIQTCVEAGKYGNPQPWCPRNSTGNFTGRMMTLKYALANSVNSITVNLMDKVGPMPVINLVKKLGISTKIPEVPSIALGTSEATVFEMTAAYGTFANEGVYVKPVLITRIEDKNGTVLFENTPETHDVVSAEVSRAVINLMEGVTRYGSGARLRTKGAETYNVIYKNVMTGYPYSFTNAIAGKTGTTQNNSDGWFIAMVPNLVTGVWVGGEDRAVHFRTTAYGQGATMALPIWGYYMKKCYADRDLSVSKEAFPPPQNKQIQIDCSKEKESEGEESPQIDF